MSKQTEPKNEEVESIIYESRDFFAIEAELEKFAIDKEQTIKGVKQMVHFVPVEGIQKWYIMQGGLADREEWAVRDISLFKELQNKMEQYDKWQRRRSYAQRMNQQEVVELANTLQVNE